MSFVVEDGTGIAGANSYTSVAFADAYFAERHNAAWTGDNNAKEGALVRATDYIDAKFGSRFLNDRKFDYQILFFPRTGYTIAIPVILQKACAEYALRALTANLFPDPVVDESGFAVVSKSDTVGPISTSRTYSSAQSSASLTRSYPSADFYMRTLVGSTQGRVYR